MLWDMRMLMMTRKGHQTAQEINWVVEKYFERYWTFNKNIYKVEWIEEYIPKDYIISLPGIFENIFKNFFFKYQWRIVRMIVIILCIPEFTFEWIKDESRGGKHIFQRKANKNFKNITWKRISFAYLVALVWLT